MRRTIIIAMLCAASLAGCAANSTPPVTEPPGPHLNVVAKDIAFDTTELKMTANQPTVIFFTNADDAPHDIAIYPNKDASTAMFEGKIVTKSSIVYDVPAFGAGTYAFRCTVHPNMNGTVQVNP